MTRKNFFAGPSKGRVQRSKSIFPAMAASPDEELASLEAEGLLRSLRPLSSPAGARVQRAGRWLENFSSNDYLGLANEPEIQEAFIEGIRLYGAGSTASRLVSGSLEAHRQLEESLAQAKHAEAALTFSSGYAASVGILSAIAGKDDFIILDKLSHASLIDGARLSGATIRVFPHNDTAQLEKRLKEIRAKSAGARIIIVTESIFSMDGDACPLAEIVEIKNRWDALLFIDEAHALGVIGEDGMGLASALKLSDQVDFQMGTFSKAAGLSGAYCALSHSWQRLLVNRARSFIYSTAPPPALAHAALHSLNWMRSEAGKKRREMLRERIDRLAPDHPSAIIPIILGPSETALAASSTLEEKGYLIPAIRFPTVPRGKARLRLSLSAVHSLEVIQSLKETLSACL
jgi:8-amino-7-oxononanoate synthase